MAKKNMPPSQNLTCHSVVALLLGFMALIFSPIAWASGNAEIIMV